MWRETYVGFSKTCWFVSNVRTDRVVISEARGIKLRKLANNVTGTVRRASLFVDVMKTILRLMMALEKKNNENVAASPIVDIEKDIICTDFVTGMSVLSFHRYVLVGKELLRYESVLTLVKCMESVDAWSKRFGFSNLDDTGLYTTTTYEL